MRKFSLLVIGVSWTIGANLFAVDTNLLEEVQRALDYVCATAPSYCLEEEYLLTDFEIGMHSSNGKPPEAIRPIVQVMSNNWQEVLLSLNEYTTSRVQRIIVENTGWFLSEDVYLAYLDNLCDQVLSNTVTFAELNNFQSNAWRNHHVASVLCRRYQENSVSNVVMKMMQVGFPTNRCEEIFSGVAYSNYVDSVEMMR